MSGHRFFVCFFVCILGLLAMFSLGTLFANTPYLFFSSKRLLPVTADRPLVSSEASPVILVDAGHGGEDPGKIGTANTLEKDLNLQIALFLKEILEAQDFQVILTRNRDTDLSTDPKHFKASDLKNRVSLIRESGADLVLSIHQNSYPSASVYGAQCFYYTDSKESELFASYLQEQIIRSTKQTKIRQIKGNRDYYLLKHSPVPAVIVECGFLSNPTEEELLTDPAYQRLMAWAISLGTRQYLNSLK